MDKKKFIELLNQFDDDCNIVVMSTTKFNGYNVISGDIELIEEYDSCGEKILVIQERSK